MSVADVKAGLARAAQSARDLAPADLVAEPLTAAPAPVDVWKLGRTIAVLPALLDGAPESYRDIMRRRAWADLTGECPDCGALTDARTQRMLHENRCIVGHLPRRLVQHYLDPDAIRFVAGLTGAAERTNR
jgi:hypothetical protein